jgi:hypothetical protein
MASKEDGGAIGGEKFASRSSSTDPLIEPGLPVARVPLSPPWRRGTIMKNAVALDSPTACQEPRNRGRRPPVAPPPRRAAAYSVGRLILAADPGA